MALRISSKSVEIRTSESEKDKLTKELINILLEQISASGFEYNLLIDGLDREATVDAWIIKAKKLKHSIERLGPINMAAIDEYKEQLKRKEYLDEQDKDVTAYSGQVVTAAVEILEQAIAKIDKETRSRFKEMFDCLNYQIKDIFPRLCGGGTAAYSGQVDHLFRDKLISDSGLS